VSTAMKWLNRVFGVISSLLLLLRSILASTFVSSRPRKNFPLSLSAQRRRLRNLLPWHSGQNGITMPSRVWFNSRLLPVALRDVELQTKQLPHHAVARLSRHNNRLRVVLLRLFALLAIRARSVLLNRARSVLLTKTRNSRSQNGRSSSSLLRQVLLRVVEMQAKQLPHHPLSRRNNRLRVVLLRRFTLPANRARSVLLTKTRNRGSRNGRKSK